jgi:predicted transcriptional regulator YdeE
MMHTQTLAEITVVGLELCTSNDVGFETIPAHWQRFASEAVLERIANKASSDVYAVYTNYANPGLNNAGVYSCVIGAAVKNLLQVPEGLTAVTLPASSYQIVPVADGRPDLVGEAWQQVWAQDASQRTFIADAERYRSDGRIDLLLGVRA